MCSHGLQVSRQCRLIAIRQPHTESQSPQEENEIARLTVHVVTYHESLDDIPAYVGFHAPYHANVHQRSKDRGSLGLSTLSCCHFETVNGTGEKPWYGTLDWTSTYRSGGLPAEGASPSRACPPDVYQSSRYLVCRNNISLPGRPRKFVEP